MAQEGQGGSVRDCYFVSPAAYKGRWDSAEHTAEAFEDKWNRYKPSLKIFPTETH